MFSFIETTEAKYIHAENVSALFLCPEITPKYASSEEQMLISALSCCLLSGVTPADVPVAENIAEYQIVSESIDLALTVALPLAAVDDLIDCESEILESEEIISVSNALSEDPCPMFLVEKHIPSNFYITVYSREYYLSSQDKNSFEDRKYCASAGGFVPHGMELKIRVQSFKL